jgi:FKBP-type peptidyl-prolyl cis-trans isomerase SlyD
MSIQADTVVQLKYRVTDAQGEVVDAGDDILEYLHGGHGGIFQAIESRLDGKEIGHEETIYLEPDDAFGEYDAALVRVVKRAELPEELEVGQTFEVEDEGEDEDGSLFTVTDVAADSVVLDGNHPLAGLALRMWVKVVDVRPASQAEILQGYPGMPLGLSVADRANDGPLH